MSFLKKFQTITTTLLSLALFAHLQAAGPSLAERCHALNNWMETNTDISTNEALFTSSSDEPLFKQYPYLAGTIPYLNFANLPSPVLKLDKLGDALSHEKLYLKNDARIGTLFGGNKVRKLCFLLAWALLHKTELILTGGGAGSNHSTATIAYAHQLGIPCESFLTEQRPTSYTRRNLLLSSQLGGALSLHSTMAERQEAILAHAAQSGKKVFYIPGGGSTSRGALGFVNAAFELAQQIRDGIMPEPDYLFVGAGSNGTAAGLGLGLSLAGLKTQVVAICTTSMTPPAFLEDCKQLYEGMLTLLQLPTPTSLRYPAYIDKYFGEGYAHLTPLTAAAIRTLFETENIKLDGTYGGKALGAFIEAAQEGAFKDKVLLFWNTFCTGSVEELGYETVDYHSLPSAFHHYFTDELQPGDLGV